MMRKLTTEECRCPAARNCAHGTSDPLDLFGPCVEATRTDTGLLECPNFTEINYVDINTLEPTEELFPANPGDPENVPNTKENLS